MASLEIEVWFSASRTYQVVGHSTQRMTAEGEARSWMREAKGIRIVYAGSVVSVVKPEVV